MSVDKIRLFKIESGDDLTYWYGALDEASCLEIYKKEMIEALGEKDAPSAIEGTTIKELTEAQGRATSLMDDGGGACNDMWNGMLALVEPGQIACSEY